MKYVKYFLKKVKKFAKGLWVTFSSWFIVIFFFILMFAAEGYTLEDFGLDGVTLNPADYCNLTDVNYTAILHDNPDGSASVEITEYLTFDVHAASKLNTFKELWRELPEETVDGLKVTYDVKSVSQILDNGKEVPYRETSKMYWEDEDYTQSSTMYWHHSDGSGWYPDNDESLLIYIPWTYREKMTFKIVYTMNNAALRYRDCSELYLSMYSGNTITKLKSYKAQILVPNNIMPSKYYAYTFGTANNRIPYTESDKINPGYHTFSIDLDESDLKFNYHNRYIEFCLLSYGKDKHIFTKYAPNNLYSNDNALQECIEENEYYETQNEKYNTYKTIMLIAAVVISALIVKNTTEKYKKMKEQYNLYEPETDYDYFREIPSDLDPIFASELVFMKDPFNENMEKQEEYASILLSLVRKKYVTITKADLAKEWNDRNTVISLEPIESRLVSLNENESINDIENKTEVDTGELTTSKKLYLELLKGYKNKYDNSINLEQWGNPIDTGPVFETINANTGEVVEELTTSERLYLDLLERHARLSRSITLETLQRRINMDYEYTNSFVKDMEKKPILESGVIEGYFEQAEYDLPRKKLNESAKISFNVALILLIGANLISYFTPMALAFGAYTVLGIVLLWRNFYLTIKGRKMILFTQYGVNEQAKWYGLYNFLNSDTLINEKEVQDLVLWEKYLIYATAFGISEKVVKAMKIHAVNLNVDNSLILNHHSYVHSHSFHTTSRSFGRSLHTSSRGGGFGGHGYGGGGRGGGGGGGGH